MKKQYGAWLFTEWKEIQISQMHLTFGRLSLDMARMSNMKQMTHIVGVMFANFKSFKTGTVGGGKILNIFMTTATLSTALQYQGMACGLHLDPEMGELGECHVECLNLSPQNFGLINFSEFGLSQLSTHFQIVYIQYM